MQIVSFNSRVVLRPTIRVKIKRRLKEAVKLIVTRGAAAEESRGELRLVFRAEDVGAEKWIVPGACVLRRDNILIYSHSFVERRLDIYGTADLRDVPHVICGATWPCP